MSNQTSNITSASMNIETSIETSILSADHYDSVSGIQSYLDRGLDGLHELIKARSEAGYKRNERLHSFIIMGRWSTDTCGNFGPAWIDGPTGENRFINRDWWAAVLRPVVDINKFFENFASYDTIPKGSYAPRMTSTVGHPPTSTTLCLECARGWTLANCHDFHNIRNNEDGYNMFHKACWKLRMSRNELEFFKHIFESAGFAEAVFNEIENNYWPKDPEYDISRSPWFRVCTHLGVFNIGWRKSVISIELGASPVVDLSVLFHNENVTKSTDLIHAHGEKKAIEYLKAIKEHLLAEKLS